ncbi:uncharacterized protein LOC108807026 [Raphanus sativus]|uniref:Uncharacterized protein LOC108807026 n=1 Tax=Raphanus sativus TaxID=3726 RepID=A0A6J0JIV5_RAPSA|nr:uncharacterized protein LOC108807026 [Raphanus sativus]
MRLFQEIALIVTQFHNNLVTEQDLVSHFRRLGPNECNKWTILNAARRTEFLFTWREKNADTVPEPLIQEDDLDTCWAIALFRGQSALVTLKESDRARLTLEMLLDGVDSQYQSESHGVDCLEDLIPFMEENFVRRMIVHHRPRGFDQVEQDEFERLIENLLVKGPVVVAFDVFPSYEEKFVAASGQGIFSPTDDECQMRLYERFIRHCVVLYGKGVEVDGSRIKEFWEALESRGDTFGDEGFVRLARGKCLLREVVELKV